MNATFWKIVKAFCGFVCALCVVLTVSLEPKADMPLWFFFAFYSIMLALILLTGWLYSAIDRMGL